jgi:hypothetical protein
LAELREVESDAQEGGISANTPFRASTEPIPGCKRIEIRYPSLVFSARGLFEIVAIS